MPIKDLSDTSFRLSDFLQPQQKVSAQQESRPKQAEPQLASLKNEEDIHLLMCWAY